MCTRLRAATRSVSAHFSDASRVPSAPYARVASNQALGVERLAGACPALRQAASISATEGLPAGGGSRPALAAVSTVMEQRWPELLWIVRHGESAGNVARQAALAANRLEIDIAPRDIDVPLSPRGERQALALGRWFARRRDAERPSVVLASPYVRTRHTATLIADAGGATSGATVRLDERLREKEVGVLDRLTKRGIVARFPGEAEARRRLGKFYYRAPGGESWCDVILRLRSLLDTVALHHGGERVLLVCHQVVVLCLRYLLEHLSEEEILAIDRAGEVANCSVTEYVFDPDAGPQGGLSLRRYNYVVPLEVEGAPVTAEPAAHDESAA